MVKRVESIEITKSEEAAYLFGYLNPVNLANEISADYGLTCVAVDKETHWIVMMYTSSNVFIGYLAGFAFEGEK